jgi:hypothetical protein
MAAARACLVALAMAAALFLEGTAAASAGNAGAAPLKQRRRQLLRQRQVRSHLKRLNKAPLATIEVLPHPSVSSLLHRTASAECPVRSMHFAFLCQKFRFLCTTGVNRTESIGPRGKKEALHFAWE